MACGWHADQDMRGPKSATQSHLRRAGERTGLHFIPPGQPWRNGYTESFSSRVRDECLNINMFWSLAQARVSDQRLEEGRQPPPTAQRPRLPGPSGLRRGPHPLMIDSH
jgi:transposase InsO family protein